VEKDEFALPSSGADVIFWIDANLFATQFPDYLIKAFLRPRFVNPFENWRWRINGGIWTLLETVFTSYFLRKVSWVIGRATIPSLFLRFVLILKYCVVEDTTVLISENVLICDLRPYFLFSVA